MSQNDERQHRPDPARDGPNRSYSDYARRHGPGGREDAVSQGVRLGYSVLEEQMREGRRLAERLRGGMRPGAAAPEYGALVERALDLYRDMGALALAAVEAMAGGRAQKPENRPAQAYALDVKSSRRVNVKFDLRGSAQKLRIGPLQHALGGAKPIESVSFEAGPTLRLAVADDQPEGVYHAVVADAESGEVAGTLTVRVGDERR
jgi:hypothetical protein